MTSGSPDEAELFGQLLPPSSSRVDELTVDIQGTLMKALALIENTPSIPKGERIVQSSSNCF